jgi:AraC family transcriptional regulator
MKADTRSFYLLAIHRVLDHLLSHLDDAVALDTLGSLAGLSPFHFHRVFRGLVGETPIELQRRLRLERAAFMLATTNLAVTRIAFEAGYEAHEAFTRAFRASFGMSPSEFRRTPAARAILAAPCGIHFNTGDVRAAFVPRDRHGDHVTMDTIQLPALRLAAVSHIGPYNQISSAFERLAQIAGPAGLFAQPGAMYLGVYHQDPETTAVDALQSHAAISVPETVPMPAGLTEMRIAGGLYARTVHTGGFEHLGDVWSRFVGEALPASGYVVTDGPALEVYRSDMRSTPMAEWQTDLLVPLHGA